MKQYALILTALITSTANATTWNSDGTAANIQSIHDTNAQNGDTITLPAGTFSWTTALNITKAVTIIGQTTTDAPGATTSNDLTIVQDNGPRTQALIQLNAPCGQRVSAITFKDAAASNSNDSVFYVQSGLTNSQPVRIDHIVFDGLVHRNNSVTVGSGYNYGVIDHCIVRNSATGNGFNIDPAQAGGTNGDEAWAAPTGFGGPNFFFVENNYQDTSSDPDAIAAIINITAGGKVVVRYNTIKGNTIGPMNHAIAMTSAGRRGGRAVEFYNNTIIQTRAGTDMVGSNGGPSLIYNNTFQGTIVPGGFDLGYYRTTGNFGSPFLGADGQNAWDYNVTESDGTTHIDGHPPYAFYSGSLTVLSLPILTDGTKNWTTNQLVGYEIRRDSDGRTGMITSNTANSVTIQQYEVNATQTAWVVGDAYHIYRVLRALDQPGMGQGNQIDRSSPAWPNPSPEPCYSWNNNYTGGSVNFTITTANGLSGSLIMLQNVLYFNNTPMPGYTPYCYPHPLTGVACGTTPTPTPTLYVP